MVLLFKSKDDYNYYDYVIQRKKKFYSVDSTGRAHHLFCGCKLYCYAIDYIDDKSLYFREVNNKLRGIFYRKYKDYDYLRYTEHYFQN